MFKKLIVKLNKFGLLIARCEVFAFRGKTQVIGCVTLRVLLISIFCVIPRKVENKEPKNQFYFLGKSLAIVWRY